MIIFHLCLLREKEKQLETAACVLQTVKIFAYYFQSLLWRAYFTSLDCYGMVVCDL